MVGPIGTTIADLRRHGMLIKVSCSGCGKTVFVSASAILTPANARQDFRQARYRCRCGARGRPEYACPPDWLD